MHLEFKEKVSINKRGDKYKEYWSLDGWFEKKFSIGYDATIYDGLEMHSLRLGGFGSAFVNVLRKLRINKNE